MDLTVKIQNLEQKIKAYKTKFPKRNPQQVSKLNHLWLELLFWELVQKGEIEFPNYLLKIEKSWEHLKQIKAKTGKWPRKELQAFLKKQKPEYKKQLVWLIELETNPEYLKLAHWLKKLITH